MHRVQKLLSNYGYCSRRKGEDLIREGRVSVNGKVIGLGDKAGMDDTIAVDGVVVRAERKRYLLFNKPVGCVTALTDRKYKTVMEYIKVKERVFPVGRLDFNTSGLLLFTNDGDFANKVMHPRYEVKKTYLVRTKGPVHTRDLATLAKGVKLSDGMTAPAKAIALEVDLIELTIHEGKNQILRRMFGKLGYVVLSLERVRIGKVQLNVKPGKYRPLTKNEMKLIFE